MAWRHKAGQTWGHQTVNGMEILGKRRNTRQWNAWKNQAGVKTSRRSGAERSRSSGVKTADSYRNWLCIHQAGVEHNQAASFLHPLIVQENHLTTPILFFSRLQTFDPILFFCCLFSSPTPGFSSPAQSLL